ncbi:MAG: hypothetical protein HZA50_13180 [Planctomycetes bacterium]|nr:hypothetical protein [Planctomycetota bacterium]
MAFFPQQSIFPKAVACPCVMNVVDIQHLFFPHYFGLPALEAVQHDKKVICSRLAVFDEIGVPKQCLIDFDNPDELLTALELPGTTALTRQPWTWQQTVQATLDILRKTAG